MAGQAAVGRQVTLKNVTIVGERRLDGQRFALVILDQTDERRYVAADRLGTSDTVALAMEKRAAAAIPGILSPLEVTDRAEEPRQHALSG